MKTLCIFLIFVFSVSCGPSVLQDKTIGIMARKRECRLVRGACKAECNTWEYVYTYCDTEPCCVVREYIKPVAERTRTSTVNPNRNALSKFTT
ncbi:beta-defensin 113 [Otolemur garnettii]|uniref:beta-defensin 113 n=1 Tax=Otolemur garnettii TaxID=30611 RepID=UPI000C7EBB85|nr:beta-defensin 113 [Otolemur garnettii]